jgi:hypothetical protein
MSFRRRAELVRAFKSVLMEQEDYLKKQIDQLGRVLGKILSDLLGYMSRGEAAQGIEAVRRDLKTGLGLDVDELLSLPAGQFLETLRTEKKLNSAALEKLSEILLLMAGNPEPGMKTGPAARSLLEKALVLDEFLETASTTYSMERKNTIRRIRSLL